MTTLEADHTPHLPPSFELDQVEMYGKYMLSSRLDIFFILRSMLKHRCMATVYFNHGQSFFLSTLLAVDNENNTLILDSGSDPAINKAVAEASGLIVSASLERVKIQFLLGSLSPTTFEGCPAFRSALPTSALRLQRREYFRLEPPAAAPLRCRIKLNNATGEGRFVEWGVADISAGGISLIAPIEQLDHCQQNVLLTNCRLEIPDEEVVLVNLLVKKAVEFSSEHREHQLRIGCEFVNVPASRLAVIERYITRIERERTAKNSRLAD